MSASTDLLDDTQTVITNGPTANTLANSILASGAIVDYQGVSKLLLTKLQEADNVLNIVDANTDPVDDATNQALIDGIFATLEGSSGPSAHVVTDMASIISNGPSVTTENNSIDPAGPIMDYPGNCFLVKLKLQEAAVLVTILVSVTATDDSTNKTLLQNIGLALT